ncbi:MAG: FixH family protein [Chitinophagaceae bacterium]|nr:FixH family protein [Chitinophagaceae bacterium]
MNWGHKLILAFSAFAIFILFMVYKIMNTNFDMVENDYYKQELMYQKKIEAYQNANALTQKIKVTVRDEEVVLQFPPELINKPLTGDAWFYCAYDKTQDKKFRLNTDKNGMQLFAINQLGPVNYTLKLSWNDGDKNYYTEIPVNLMK